MFLTIAYWFFLAFGYCAIGAVFHDGLRKVVNANRWDPLRKKKEEAMDSLETEWSKGAISRHHSLSRSLAYLDLRRALFCGTHWE